VIKKLADDNKLRDVSKSTNTFCSPYSRSAWLRWYQKCTICISPYHCYCHSNSLWSVLSIYYDPI